VTPTPFFALAAAIVLVGPARGGDEAAAAQAKFAHAVAHHQAGRFTEAIAAYQAFLELQPKNVEARSNLGAALAHEGRYTEAIEEYRRALALAPDRVAVRLNLALALYKAWEIAPAAAELEKVLAAQPDQKNARLLLADCFLRMGRFKDVVEVLAPLEAVAEQEHAVAYLLGQAFILDKQPARGQLFIDYILRDGDSAEAHLLMGVARLAASEPAAARDDFARAVELNPKLPSAHANLGQTLMQLGDTDRAAVELAKELEQNPNDYDANLNLGVILRQQQRYPEAMARFRRALSVRPASSPVRYQIGSLHFAQGEVDEARTALEAVVADEPRFVEAHVSLATVYYRLKRKEDGDRERAIVDELNRETQAKQPGARDDLGPAYRGEIPPAAPPDWP
jgi:tetratricopeptide (TPR) repeat protein